MFDLNFDLYSLTVLFMLSIISFLLNTWRKEHNDLMIQILQTLSEIKKKIG